MTTLTPTEQQAVDKAAQEFADMFSANFFTPERITSFKRGVEYALSALVEPRSVAFAEWCAGQNIFMSSDGVWYAYNKQKPFAQTTSELYSIYNEQLNKQQDGNEKI